MKKLIYMLSAVLTATLLSVSCVDTTPDTEKPDEKPDDKPNTPEVVDPVFPTSIEVSLEAGESHTLSIEPNVDWSIELKYAKESTGWFWIQDGNSQVYSLNGKAGEKIDIVVMTSDQTDYDIEHECTLDMTMGDSTVTIARFTRGTIDRTFSLAYCVVEEGDYAYSEAGSDLQYQYEAPLTAENNDIPMMWNERTKDFRRSIVIEANFEWQLLEKPEWMLVMNTVTAAANTIVEVEIEGDPKQYPLEGAEGQLVFCAKSNVEATYTFDVIIPGCEDIFSIEGFAKEINANAIGEIYSETSGIGSWIPAEIGISGYVTGIEGASVYVFSQNSEGLWEEEASWVNAAFTEWEYGGEVIQSRELTITLAENTDGARRAMVMALPANRIPLYGSALFSEDGKTVAQEYEEYVVTYISQEEPVIERLVYVADEFAMAELGTTLVYHEEHWANGAYNTEEAYTLKYISQFAFGMPSSNLKTSFDVVSWKYYDFEGQEMSSSKSWIEVISTDERTICIDMFPEKDKFSSDAQNNAGVDNMGFVVLYDENGAKAFIECIFHEQEMNGEVNDVIHFLNPDAVSGATLVQVTSENVAELTELYKDWTSDGYQKMTLGEDIMTTNTYILTYNVENPTGVELYFEGYEYDPTMEEELCVISVMPASAKSWLKHSGTEDSVTVTMTKPDTENRYGMVQLREGWTIETILYCVPAF